jgi:hypothetical protein
MRKIALLLAATLLALVPFVAAIPSGSHAQQPKAKAPPSKGGPAQTGDPNTAFPRAVDDLLSGRGNPGGKGAAPKGGKGAAPKGKGAPSRGAPNE